MPDATIPDPMDPSSAAAPAAPDVVAPAGSPAAQRAAVLVPGEPAPAPADITTSAPRAAYPLPDPLWKYQPGPGCHKVDPILIGDSIKKSYGGLVAVDVQHVEIPRHAITALIGPNGAGKTTFFNLITAFDKADRGQWEFNGTQMAGVPAWKVARMGQVRTFQLTKAFGGLSVLDSMKLGARGQRGESFWASLVPPLWRAQERDIEQRALELLTEFKLVDKKDDLALSMSGGQRKLLEMARALMSDPELVMLDEPMAGVNPALVQSLLGHIVRLKEQGMTVVFVEHDMHMVQTIADWVIVMAEGQVVAEGVPSEVMSDPVVIDAYLGANMDRDLHEVVDEIRADYALTHPNGGSDDSAGE